MNRTLGKIAGAMAQVAAPAALEEQKARLLDRRDQLLSGYRQQEQQSRQAFSAEQNRLARDQSASQHAEEVGLRREEMQATADYRQGQIGREMARDQLTADARARADAINSQQLSLAEQHAAAAADIAAKQKLTADMEYELAQLSLDTAKKQKEFEDKILSEQDPAKRQAMLDMYYTLRFLKGTSKGSQFKFIPEEGDLGKTGNIIRTNAETGEAVNLGRPPSVSTPQSSVDENDPLGIRKRLGALGTAK